MTIGTRVRTHQRSVSRFPAPNCVLRLRDYNLSVARERYLGSRGTLIARRVSYKMMLISWITGPQSRAPFRREQPPDLGSSVLRGGSETGAL